MCAQCVLLSIRLSPQAIRHLLEETQAKNIIVSSRTRSTVEHSLAVQVNAEVSLHEARPLESLLQDSEDPIFESKAYCRRTKQCVREDDCNVLILHSSGTTGLPKPIRLSHRYMLGYAACHELPTNEDESLHGINLSTLPLFHGFGLLAPCLSLAVGKPLCLPPATTIPTGKLVHRLLQNRGITSLMTVPTILEEMTQMHDSAVALTDLANLDYVACGGGALKTATGEILRAKKVIILNHFGATELGALAPIFRPGEDYDWKYLRVRKDMKLQLQSLDENEEDDGACKLIGRPFGWSTDFELQDHLQRNPARPEREVRILGRKDDIVVLATGEKVQPHVMERQLEMNPLIKSAVVIGSGQFEVGVIVEPVSNLDETNDSVIDSVWANVATVNKLVDQHARIWSKAAIIVAPPQKPIPLSDKGTPQRSEAYARFEPEIRCAYDALRDTSSFSAVYAFDPKDAARSLRVMVQACLPEHHNGGFWKDEDDFIHLGIDSLQAKRLHQMVLQSLLSSGQIEVAKSIKPDFVYANSSVDKMVGFISHSGSPRVGTDSIEQLVAKYSYGQDDKLRMSQDRERLVVLLTGSTGNIGAHLLQVLAASPLTSRIICLIRDDGSGHGADTLNRLLERQKAAMRKRSIDLSEHEWEKISMFVWVPGDERLGMKPNEYQNVLQNVTHVFHGAWPMDFRRRLSSFEPHIKATQQLLDLCRAAHRLRAGIRPKFILASSIAVVGHYNEGHGGNVVPELPVSSTSALNFSYAEAKLVCERVVESACTWLHSELQPSIVRIGQISGASSTGYWTVREHVPELVRASQRLGSFPDLQGTVSWLSVESAARILSEVLLSSSASSLVYHVENPIRQPWSDVCTVMERKLGLESRKRKPFKDWLAEALGKGYLQTDLSDFFEQDFVHMSSGGVLLNTQNCRQVSQECYCTSSVKVQEIEGYLAYWKDEAFLQ